MQDQQQMEICGKKKKKAFAWLKHLLPLKHLAELSIIWGRYNRFKQDSHAFTTVKGHQTEERRYPSLLYIRTHYLPGLIEKQMTKKETDPEKKLWMHSSLVLTELLRTIFKRAFSVVGLKTNQKVTFRFPKSTWMETVVSSIYANVKKKKIWYTWNENTMVKL